MLKIFGSTDFLTELNLAKINIRTTFVQKFATPEVFAPNTHKTYLLLMDFVSYLVAAIVEDFEKLILYHLRRLACSDEAISTTMSAKGLGAVLVTYAMDELQNILLIKTYCLKGI